MGCKEVWKVCWGVGESKGRCGGVKKCVERCKRVYGVRAYVRRGMGV